MTTHCDHARLTMDCETFRTSFDREPFAFTHTLNELDLFAFDKLHTLAKKYQRDFYVAGGASAPGTEFYAVPRVEYKPHEAIERLDSGAYRVLLKRPEKYEPRFRELLNALFHQVVELRGGLGSEKIVRLESAILISSADTITPFHFDPEIGFFSQIEGEKTYHVYSPTVVTEAELEPFYLWGEIWRYATDPVSTFSLSGRAKDCINPKMRPIGLRPANPGPFRLPSCLKPTLRVREGACELLITICASSG